MGRTTGVQYKVKWGCTSIKRLLHVPANRIQLRTRKNENNPICNKCQTTTNRQSQQCSWPIPQQHQLEQPPTIKAITPRLYDNHHNTSHHRLHDCEKQQLKQLQSLHPDKGKSIPHTHHFFQWMGVADSYFHTMRETCPCHTEVSPHHTLNSRKNQQSNTNSRKSLLARTNLVK